MEWICVAGHYLQEYVYALAGTVRDTEYRDFSVAPVDMK